MENCPECGQSLEEMNVNIRLNRLGIDVLIVGGHGLGCSNCKRIVKVPQDISDHVDALIREKKEYFPESPNGLYVNLL